ncbi:MAG: hypothetical protein JO127_15550 [Caulobacteraceae bacterium]|nr:hypothetical protein [Caulobacteraceae bacterium]
MSLGPRRLKRAWRAGWTRPQTWLTTKAPTVLLAAATLAASAGWFLTFRK